MDKKQKEIAFLSALVYFGQGAVGIAGITLPLQLRRLQWSIEEIAAVTFLVSLPWVFKIVYGFISDTFPLWGYRRKSYLIVCCFLAALGWLALAFSRDHKILIIASLLLGNLGFAGTDVIADGLVVEHSTKESSPTFQGIAWGSRSVGAIFSGVAGGWLAAHWSPFHVYLLTVSLPLLVLIPVLKLHEQKWTRPVFSSFVDPLKKCFKLILRGNLRWFLVVLIFFSSAASFSVPFFFHLKEKLGFEETFLGILVSIGQSGALLGSLLYVLFLRRFNPGVVLKAAIAISAFNILATLLIRSPQTALAVVFFGGVLGYVALLPLMSAAALLTHNTSVEGTLFALLMGIYNLGQIFFGMLGGKLFKYIGLNALIIGTALFMLLGIFAAQKLVFNEVDDAGEAAA